MLQRALSLFFLMTTAIFTAAIYYYAAPRPTDFAEYELSKVEGAAQRSSRALQRQPALQKRSGVRKDFWIPEDSGRSHFFIASKTSELILNDRSGKIEATEYLKNLEGSLEEKDSCRRFTATEGTYFYPSHRFLTRNAEIGLYRDIETIPFLQGTAGEANFSFFAKNRLFNAKQVELKSGSTLRVLGETAAYSALANEMGFLEITPSCRIEFPDAFLQCEGPLELDLQESLAETHHSFHYEESQIRIDAESGRLLYGRDEENRLKPQMIQCEGAVRMLAKENYALADQLVYFPETQKLHLLAGDRSRVLFWKSDGSIQISAPEVRARFDGKEHREEINGIGDVHCTFDLEEEHRIETLFGKYLE